MNTFEEWWDKIRVRVNLQSTRWFCAAKYQRPRFTYERTSTTFDRSLGLREKNDHECPSLVQGM